MLSMNLSSGVGNQIAEKDEIPEVVEFHSVMVKVNESFDSRAKFSGKEDEKLQTLSPFNRFI